MDLLHQIAWWYIFFGASLAVAWFVVWPNFKFDTTKRPGRFWKWLSDVLFAAWIIDILFWALTGLIEHAPF